MERRRSTGARALPAEEPDPAGRGREGRPGAGPGAAGIAGESPGKCARSEGLRGRTGGRARERERERFRERERVELLRVGWAGSWRDDDDVDGGFIYSRALPGPRRFFRFGARHRCSTFEQGLD